MMNRIGPGQQVLVLNLAALILAGCSGALAEPTSTPTPVPPTPTLTPVLPTPTPTPRTLVITDEAFLPEACQGSAVIEISAVEGDSLGIYVREGSLSIRGGRMTIWCSDIEHVWMGRLSYANHTFDSVVDNPLRFLLVGDRYEYVGGAGTVTLPDGTKVTLP